MAMIEKYLMQFEGFGKVFFQKAPSTESRTGQRERFALLNEDQALFLLALSKNTTRVVELKARLIGAFREARHAAELRQVEYQPAYRALHDAIKLRAAGSANAHWVHSNANRELNRIAGVKSGHRSEGGPLQQSLLALCCAVAAKAVENAREGIKVHECIKTALKPLDDLLALSSKPEAT